MTSAGIGRDPRLQTKERDPSLLRTDQDTISEDQAKWFLMLPDKTRKQHFSRQDQAALMVRCKKILEHVFPNFTEDTSRGYVDTTRGNLVSHETAPRPSTSAGSATGESQSFLAIDVPTIRSDESVSAELEIVKLYSGPDASETEENHNNWRPPLPQGSLPPPPSDSNAVAVPRKTKRKSLHRKLSLTPLPLPPPVLAPPVPPVPPAASLEPVRHFGLSTRLSRPFVEPMDAPPDPPAQKKDYRDPNARKQLRNALVSPEKFDEALAFGFSPTDKASPSPSAEDQSFPIQQPPLCHSDNEEDDDHSVDTHGPRTPTTISDNQAAIKLPSFDSATEFPFVQNNRPKTSSSRSPAGSVGNREMTIHMTLTRRDLSSPEEELYSVQRRQNSGIDVEKVDPLALETLPVCDDPTGAHGAFAVQDSVPKGLKRVWKTIRRQ